MNSGEQKPAFFAGAQELCNADHLKMAVESGFQEQQVSQIAKQNNHFLRTFSQANTDYDNQGNQNLLTLQLKQVLS